MNTIPLEAQPFAIAASILAVGAIVFAIRLSITSRAFGILKQASNDLEAHLLRAQRDLASTRDDSAEWRLQIQQQFDLFRATTTGQLTMAEARFERLQNHFDDASKAADKTQLELRTQLDVLRGMCAELPFARTRILELERSLAAAPEWTAEPAPLLPLPALADEPKINGTNGHAITLTEIPVMPEMDESRLSDLEAQLAVAAQRNATLQRELISMRVRSAKVATTGKTKRARS